MAVPILEPKPERWWCPSCGLKREIPPAGAVTTPMHQCDATGGLDIPLIEWKANSKAVRQRVVEREDYVGDAKGIRYIEGRPVMAVVTDRADGSNDTTVYAPLAEGRA